GATRREMSGSGGPKVTPLIESAPVGAVPLQTGFVVSSHSVRQSFSKASLMTGKLCEVPVHPLSRSVPVPRVFSTSSFGPPAGFAGQSVDGTDAQAPPPGGGQLP